MPINIDTSRWEELSAQQKKLYEYVSKNGIITSHQAEELLQVKQRRARAILSEMVALGVLKKQGAYKSTAYIKIE